jgi:hypothetical protein
LVSQLVVVRHFGISDDIFKAMIFFGDHPDVSGSWNALRAGNSGNK